MKWLEGDGQASSYEAVRAYTVSYVTIFHNLVHVKLYFLLKIYKN